MAVPVSIMALRSPDPIAAPMRCDPASAAARAETDWVTRAAVGVRAGARARKAARLGADISVGGAEFVLLLEDDDRRGRDRLLEDLGSRILGKQIDRGELYPPLECSERALCLTLTPLSTEQQQQLSRQARPP